MNSLKNDVDRDAVDQEQARKKDSKLRRQPERPAKQNTRATLKAHNERYENSRTRFLKLLPRNGTGSADTEELRPDEVVEARTLAAKLVVRSLLGNLPVLHHHDRVGGLKRREAVREG